MRSPEVWIALANYYPSAVTGLKNAWCLLLYLDCRSTFIDRRITIGLYGGQRGNDQHQAHDEPLALQNNKQIFLQIHLSSGRTITATIRLTLSQVRERAIQIAARTRRNQTFILSHNFKPYLIETPRRGEWIGHDIRDRAAGKLTGLPGRDLVI